MVTNESILLPVFGLALWTVVMLLWTLVTRIPAINAQGGVGGFGHPLDMAKLPVHVRRISDNHNHLYEQPTIFYAVCLAVAVLGHATETLVLLACKDRPFFGPSADQRGACALCCVSGRLGSSSGDDRG